VKPAVRLFVPRGASAPNDARKLGSNGFGSPATEELADEAGSAAAGLVRPTQLTIAASQPRSLLRIHGFDFKAERGASTRQRSSMPKRHHEERAQSEGTEPR
jgi:hypothetical protein